MSGIQLLLIAGVSLITVYFIQRMKAAVFSVLLMALLCLTAIFFILQPELTSRIANYFGVGRGADLVFYIFILLFWFIMLKLYARIRKLEATVTELARKISINSALNETRGND